MTPAPPTPESAYRGLRARSVAQEQKLDRLGLVLANLRLALFLGALAVAGLSFWGKLPGWTKGLAAGLALGFVAAAVAHDRVLARQARAKERILVNERGLARIEGRFSELPERGDSHLEPEHPYARDLDVFGPASLFQLLDATGTRFGDATLAAWLAAPSAIGQIVERQRAVAELAGRLELRQSLEVEGRLLATRKPDPSSLLDWAEGPRPTRSLLFRLAPLALPPITLALYLLGRFALLPAQAWLAGFLAQLAVFALTARTCQALFTRIGRPGERLLDWRAVFASVEHERFEAGRLRALSERMRTEGAPPSVEARRLARAALYVQVREQPLIHLPLNAFLLWDLHWARVLDRWQARCGSKVRGWFEALGELEALSSLAGFSFDNPAFPFPTFVEDGPRLLAEALGHPLLHASRRVANDVALPAPGTALVVTGSNMAGKTTLLRTLGVNAVLAQAGAPVCARALTLSSLKVATSMRVEDSLAQGISLFYAELKRLKAVLDRCESGPTLFLLDEVLLGTNTAERQAASRAILRRLVERGAIGAVATHDLGLTTLEAATSGRVRNVHFTDRIEEGQMRFDYLMRPGVVATTNALALLQKVGIEIEIET